ncbi:MAG TPA: hypothetical protein VLT88_15805, partial [Desulfosarcina sp.]|nr:hypothetical protein [Desulfosarcina sp.]
MHAAYMPFTYIPEPAARRLARLAGPVVVYQPLAANVPPGMTALSTDGRLDLRAPIAGEDARMRAAMAEFLEWGRSNPGRSTAGADFLGARQGEIPFFDETAVNRIRSDIRRFQSTGQPADPTEAAFSLRLFLALAQDNDMAADRLDQDLIRINALEKDFLETLNDADDAAFSR